MPLSFLVFPVAGMFAALVTMCWPTNRILSWVNPLGSLFFAVAIAPCMWLFSGLRSIHKTIVFFLGSFVAAVAGTLSAIYVTGRVFSPAPLGAPVADQVAFTGGFVGAFVLLAAALSSFSGKTLRVLIQSACWAVAGGSLAVLGNASGEWFRIIRSHFDFLRVEHANQHSLLRLGRNDELALVIIWHTGMGLVIALAVWFGQKASCEHQSGASASCAP
ncbi:MAG TPA: hypothetical protein VGJ33_01055 [Candidatus Angelobacter sp.]